MTKDRTYYAKDHKAVSGECRSFMSSVVSGRVPFWFLFTRVTWGNEIKWVEVIPSPVCAN